MQNNHSCVSDTPATPLVANPPIRSTQLISLFTSVLDDPNHPLFDLTAEYFADLATKTGVSLTHPEILPIALPLMLQTDRTGTYPTDIPPILPSFERDFFTAHLNNALRATFLVKKHMEAAVGKPEDPPPSPRMVENSVNEAEWLLEEVENFLRRLATVYGVDPQAWKRDERLEDF